MTLPQAATPRKPRRLGLFVPFALLLVLAGALSLSWLWLRCETLRAMNGARRSAAAGAEQFDWTSRSLTGFPFRLDLDLAGVRVGEPSGWGILAPRLKAEAFVFAPTHWVVVAPQGVIVRRRRDGPLIITAKVLRASLSGLDQHPWRLSVEGVDLIFATPPGARPFFIDAAKGFHLHTRAGPRDQGAIYIALDQAEARLIGLIGRIADGKPVNLTIDALFSHAAAVAGPDWPGAVRAWSQSGGDLTVRRLRLKAGRAVIDARAGVLSVGADGRLRGSLNLTLGQAPRALMSMGQVGSIAPEAARAAANVVSAQGGGPLATLDLDFQAGRTTLGPVAIGPAPRVY